MEWVHEITLFKGLVMKLRVIVSSIVVALALANGNSSQAALTGEYLFEEGSGLIAEDSSGFNRDGTLTDGAGTGAPTYTSGLYQGSTSALLFNGANKDRVALPQNQDFIRNAPGASIMAWVRIDQVIEFGAPTVFPTIAQVNSADPSAFAGFGGARAAITNSHNFGFRSVGSRISEARNGLNTVLPNTRDNEEGGPDPFLNFFVVGVFDYVNGTNTFYLDGVQIAQNINVATWNGLSHDAANLYASIGANPDPAAAASVAWTGAIDGVRIFDEVLSAQTILDTYNAELLVPSDDSADFNGDDIVDGTDFLIFQRGLGSTMQSDSSNGDADGSGIVDGLDLQVFMDQFGTDPPSGIAGVAIPEPSSAALMAILAAIFAGSRFRPVAVAVAVR